jgi:hypothetical protein
MHRELGLPVSVIILLAGIAAIRTAPPRDRRTGASLISAPVSLNSPLIES